MELDKFISNSLKSLIKGIKDAQDFAKENEARINPHIGDWDFGREQTTYIKNKDGAVAVSKIDFDIAVAVSNTQETDGEGGINVYALKLGTKLSDIEKNETVSRIKFTLNVALPSSES
ncbi:hypothetical protein H7F37_03600 [Winogradskyella sp. PAMC22761]|nr:hypothetical protein H7F37_03600 [Winogradskyella sp. PAMC22761]